MKVGETTWCPGGDIASRQGLATPGEKESPFQKALDKAIQEKNDRKLLQACQELESILLYQVIRAMRATVPRTGFFGSSFGGEVFESMLDEEYARNMAKSGATSLAEVLYRQLRV
ncbi:MAG: flagellar biosynthesis protein FlgJ [Syntrophomonadaceae bacterium]|nr:flagellar biosynthesis protein FlgJ [Syntrophomonadaceae bacterium]